MFQNAAIWNGMMRVEMLMITYKCKTMMRLPEATEHLMFMAFPTTLKKISQGLA